MSFLSKIAAIHRFPLDQVRNVVCDNDSAGAACNTLSVLSEAMGGEKALSFNDFKLKYTQHIYTDHPLPNYSRDWEKLRLMQALPDYAKMSETAPSTHAESQFNPNRIGQTRIEVGCHIQSIASFSNHPVIQDLREIQDTANFFKGLLNYVARPAVDFFKAE